MKKSAIILALIISATCRSQINLENSYPASGGSFLTVNEFVKHGHKYTFVNTTSKTIKLYNPNHSIFKTINYTIPTGMSLYTYPNLSDSLFNSDNLIEFVYSYWGFTSTVTPATYTFVTNIMNENGSVLLNIPQGMIPTVVFTGTATGYKLVVTMDSLNKTSLQQTNIYSLVGGLPLHSAHSNTPLNQSSLIKINGNGQSTMDVIPNPSGNKTIIYYQLSGDVSEAELIIYDLSGKVIKSYKVDRTFNSLEIDNTDIPSGTYFYKMPGITESKKMIIVK